MRGGAELIAAQLVAAELPAEFHGPVGFWGLWPWLAVAAVVLVIAYYLAAWLATRPAAGSGDSEQRTVPLGVQERYLARLEAQRVAVESGEIAARTGHQRISVVIRHFVEETTGLPATRLSLADVRQSAPALAQVLAVLYPPEFAPDEAVARTEFASALAEARRLIIGGAP